MKLKVTTDHKDLINVTDILPKVTKRVFFRRSDQQHGKVLIQH